MKRLLMILLATMLCFAAATAESSVYYIDAGSADRVHLREEASMASDSQGLYFTGTSVIVIDWYDEWAWVMIGDVTGHVMAKYLTPVETPMAGPWQVVENPHSTWVNLRMSPSMDGMIAMCPDNGTAVRILGETADGWSYVDCDGVMGYMRTELLREADDQMPMNTTVLGQTADFYYIHQYTAPNGQHIYFTAWEDNVYLDFQDVNFDGIEDIVVDTVTGANNLFSEFFVYDKTTNEYVRVVTDSAEERLCNYQLYPAYDLVATYTNVGNAGLLHATNLYRWEGNDLRLIRSAVSDEWTEDIFEGSTYTQIIHGDILHVVVRDHTKDYDDSVLLELILPKEAAETRDIFTEESDALWQGIK